MAAKFEIKQASNGQYMFNLKAANGQVILTSEMYGSKSGAENGIASVKTNAPLDERYERKTSSDGSHYFALRAANHQVIGASQMYASAAAMEAGVASVKENAPTATIAEV